MFLAIGLATARQVRFGGALRASSRFYLYPSTRSAAVIPSGFRFVAAFQRGFATKQTTTTTSKTTKGAATKPAATKTAAAAAKTTKATSKASASKATTSKTAASSKSTSKPKTATKASTAKKLTKAKTPAALRREKAAISAKAKKEKAAAAAKARKEKKAAADKAKKEQQKAAAKEKKQAAAIAKKEKAALAKERKKEALLRRRERAAAVAAKKKERKATQLAKQRERKAAAAQKAKEKRAAAAARKKERENSPTAIKRRELEKLRELRKAALLKEIIRAPTNPWSIFAAKNLTETIKEQKAVGGNQKSAFKALLAKYRSLPEEEMETLRLQARQNRLANDVAYKAWIASHTPSDILEANKARIQLKHLGVKTKPTISDPRIPARPQTSFIRFFTDRLKTGHYENVPQPKIAASIGAEWRSLSEAARQPYVNAAKLDADRYHREMQTLHQ